MPIFEGTMKNFRAIENQKGIATICLLHIQHADLGRVILFETDGTFPLQGSFPVIPSRRFRWIRTVSKARLNRLKAR